MLRNQAFLLLLKNTKFPTPGDLLSEVGTGQCVIALLGWPLNYSDQRKETCCHIYRG